MWNVQNIGKVISYATHAQLATGYVTLLYWLGPGTVTTVGSGFEDSGFWVFGVVLGNILGSIRRFLFRNY